MDKLLLEIIEKLERAQAEALGEELTSRLIAQITTGQAIICEWKAKGDPIGFMKMDGWRDPEEPPVDVLGLVIMVGSLPRSGTECESADMHDVGFFVGAFEGNRWFDLNGEEVSKPLAWRSIPEQNL